MRRAETLLGTGPRPIAGPVPMSNVPPALTYMLPPTRVRVLEATRLKVNVPLIVVVLAVSAIGPAAVAVVLLSTVTVVPAAITTGLQDVGRPLSQVLATLHAPFPT